MPCVQHGSSYLARRNQVIRPTNGVLDFASTSLVAAQENTAPKPDQQNVFVDRETIYSAEAGARRWRRDARQ